MKILAILIIVGSMVTGAGATNYYIPDGDVSALKAAITASNTNNQPDTIHLFPYSIYKLTTIDNNFIFASNALPRIEVDNFNVANSLTIRGNGAKLVLDITILSEVRILYLEGRVDIYDLGFINGSAEYDEDNGGAIYGAGGTMNLYGCLFKNNSAFQGGAIYFVSGNVSIDNCTFIENDGMFLGGVICSLSASVFIKNSVIVNNKCTNTSVPGAIYTYSFLHSPAATNISVYGSIIAGNTYENASSPNNGKEFDLAAGSGIYTIGFNFVGAHDNSFVGNPPAFVSCLPCSNGDYVGTSASVIDPMLGAFDKKKRYQESFDLLPGSLALLSYSGLSAVNSASIASYGIFPAYGEEGDKITIYGSNLSKTISIDFEGASITSGFTATDSSVVVTVPPGAATGKITITDYNYIPATSRQVFTIGANPDPDPDPDPVTDVEEHTITPVFSCYPNPVSTFLHVNADGKSFYITDAVGKEMLRAHSEVIDVSNFRQGLYLIRCGSSTAKFFKK